MQMKKIWCSILLIFLATGLCAANVPDLLGKWTGHWSGYDEGKGYTNITESGTANFYFMGQMGRIFNGTLAIDLKNGTKINEDFAGAIGLDNKTLDIVEFNKGYALGTIISNNEMEIDFLSDGENGSISVDKLQRVGTMIHA